MGTIEKRGKNSWRVGVQVREGDGWRWIRQTLRMDPSLTERQQRKRAEQALRELEADVEAGEVVPSRSGYTVRSWSEVWMDEQIRPNCSPVTYANYRYLLDSRILPLLGDELLARLTPLRLTEWLNAVRDSPRRSTRLDDDQLSRRRPPSQKLVPDRQRAKPLSAKTVLHYYTCMESMLAAAVRMEILDRNPMEQVQRPKVRRSKARSLTEAQALELLRCLADEPNMCYRAAVLLALWCGLRLGEVGELKLSDVDWDACTIDISRALKYTPQTGAFAAEPKTESSERVIALPAGMMAILAEARDYQEECRALIPHLWQGDGWIVHGWDGRQLNHDTPSKWFRRFADAHGFEGIRFHDLRHTHASILLANSIDVVAVAHRLGHSDPSTTLRIYAHAMARRDFESASMMDRLFAGIQLPPRPDLTFPADQPAADPQLPAADPQQPSPDAPATDPQLPAADAPATSPGHP